MAWMRAQHVLPASGREKHCMMRVLNDERIEGLPSGPACETSHAYFLCKGIMHLLNRNDCQCIYFSIHTARGARHTRFVITFSRGPLPFCGRAQAGLPTRIRQHVFVNTFIELPDIVQRDCRHGVTNSVVQHEVIPAIVDDTLDTSVAKLLDGVLWLSSVVPGS